MTITRVGSNEKYASGWEAAFGKAKPAKKAGGSTDKGSTAKKGAKKAAPKAAKSAKAPKSAKSSPKKTAAKKKGK